VLGSKIEGVIANFWHSYDYLCVVYVNWLEAFTQIYVGIVINWVKFMCSCDALGFYIIKYKEFLKDDNELGIRIIMIKIQTDNHQNF
jgi:hypothetical protein